MSPTAGSLNETPLETNIGVITLVPFKMNTLNPKPQNPIAIDSATNF